MKSNCIELPGREPIPILYGDRSVMAVDDEPRGWMLAPPTHPSCAGAWPYQKGRAFYGETTR